MAKKNLLLKLLINVVMQPRKYAWFINMPGRFDAAEYLYIHHWEDLSNKQGRVIEALLVSSGKYVYTNA